MRTTEAVAGFLVGKSCNEVVIVDSYNKAPVATLRIRGKKLYCKKCVMEVWGNGSLIVTEARQKDHSLLLVLAVGDKCSKDAPKVGEIISTPWDDPLDIQRSPYHPEEYFIGERIAQLAVKKAG